MDGFRAFTGPLRHSRIWLTHARRARARSAAPARLSVQRVHFRRIMSNETSRACRRRGLKKFRDCSSHSYLSVAPSRE